MGTPDKPGSLTPTELYAMQNEGASPGGDTAYERFRKRVAQATKGTNDIAAKFQQWKDANPGAKWALDAAPLLGLHGGAEMLRGAIGAGQAAAVPSAPLNQPVAPEELRQPMEFQREYPGVGPTVTPNQLPNAPPTYKMAPGMGPGGDVSAGFGTDKALLGAQQDYLGDLGGLQEKKGEEVTAHLSALNTAADLKSAYAGAQANAARAYEQAVSKSEDEQRAMETNVQKATDEASARGVDPGRFFRNRDVGFWANMLIGSIASGVLSAMSGRGGENTFLSYVRGMVQDDIQSQDRAIDQGWKRVRGLETSYERMRQLGVDRVTATQKQYDMTLQAFSTEIQARLQKAQIPEEKARLEGALQEIQIERDKENVKLQEYWKAVHERRASAAAAAVMAQRSADRQARLDADEHTLKMSQANKNMAEADKLSREAGVGGLSKEDQERMRSLQAGFSGTSNEIASFEKGLPGSKSVLLPGARYIPGSDAQSYRQRVDDWNARATLLLGPVVETMNKGKPGAVELRSLQEEVHITPEMSQPQVLARMRRLQKLQQDAAATLNQGDQQPLQRPPAFGAGTSFSPKAP